MREWVKHELLTGGDGTILWFLPTGGAYVFPGDGRNGKIIRNAADLETYFRPSFTVANREDLEASVAGDGPDSVEGARRTV